MRNWNYIQNLEPEGMILVQILPMRNWNRLFAFVLLPTPFRSDLTYEELKPGDLETGITVKAVQILPMRNWNRNSLVIITEAGVFVQILPMRNWNLLIEWLYNWWQHSSDLTYEELKPAARRHLLFSLFSSDLTYEELKHQTNILTGKNLFVQILPMRNWNSVAKAQHILTSNTFRSYLWGIETHTLSMRK